MLLDKNLVFGLPAITDSNTPTNSLDVFDAGSAVKLFGGPEVGRLRARAAVTAAANPSFRVDLVGSDAAALNSNNVIIASSGVVAHKKSGATLASGDVVDVDVAISEQLVAKRYYGLIITLGGTTPDILIDAAQGYVVFTGDARAPS